jgi:putative membrane protein
MFDKHLFRYNCKRNSIMPMTTEEERPARGKNRRVHMANERTFLAWIRTSLGIMAFGFVVERFALFMRQISHFIGASTGQPGIAQYSPTYSTVLGIFLVGLGTLMGFFSFIRFWKVERQIEADTYRPSKILNVLLAFSVLATGVFLIFYLFRSTR